MMLIEVAEEGRGEDVAAAGEAKKKKKKQKEEENELIKPGSPL